MPLRPIELAAAGRPARDPDGSGTRARLNRPSTCGRWAVLPLLAGLAWSCAPTRPALSLGPVVVPMHTNAESGSSEAVTGYYATVFARMRDAWSSGTADGLRELRVLLQQHTRPDMPADAAQRLRQFARLADGLQFELELADRCRVEHSSARLPESRSVHTPQSYQFVMPPHPSGAATELGGGGEREAAFQVHMRLRDFDAAGEVVDLSESLTLRVDRRTRVVTGHPLVLGFQSPAAPRETVIREVSIRVELLPCVVRLGDEELQVSQPGGRRQSGDPDRLSPAQRLRRGIAGYTACCTFHTMLFPAGYQAVQTQPLATLRVALAGKQAKHFPHQFLAAYFMPDQDREAAMALWIDAVRVGTPAQARVAMGALRLVSRANLPVSDRESWLLWWQAHQQTRGRRAK